MTLNHSRRHLIRGLAALTCTDLLAGNPAHAQSWPNGPIRLIHGYAAGQTPDILARHLAPSMSENLGVPIVVEARPGAGERLAATQVARLPPDGQSIYIMTGGLTVITATDKSIQFDLLKDFTYISLLNQYPFMVWVAAQSPFKNLADLLDGARQRPGKLSYATSGVANTLHMSMELLCSMANVTMNHVPYKGATMLTDLVGGVIDVTVATAATAQALMREGRLRPLAVTSSSRWPGWETVPAVAETVPGYDVLTWSALTAPAGLPNTIRDRLGKAVRETLSQPDVVSKIETAGSVPRSNGSDEMRALVASNIDKWKRVAEYAKIQLN